MIYFARIGEDGPIKVGCAVDVERRLNELEQHYQQPVALLHTMEGGRQTEREIHARFAHLRFGSGRKRRPEQFRPGPDLMEFIGKPLLVSAHPDTVETAVQLRAVRLEVSEEEHAVLRVEAAKQDKSLGELARIAVREYLAKHTPKGGKK